MKVDEKRGDESLEQNFFYILTSSFSLISQTENSLSCQSYTNENKRKKNARPLAFAFMLIYYLCTLWGCGILKLTRCFSFHYVEKFLAKFLLNELLLLTECPIYFLSELNLVLNKYFSLQRILICFNKKSSFDPQIIESKYQL